MASFWERHPVAAGISLVLLVTALVGGIALGVTLLRGPVAKVTNPSKVEQKVYDPNNTIAQIAFFHNTCNLAAAQLRIVENNGARLRADWRTAALATDPIRKQQALDQLSQDETDLAGAKNALQTTVADYDSRSAQSTANVFKDSGLPERIQLPDPIPAGYSINCG